MNLTVFPSAIICFSALFFTLSSSPVYAMQGEEEITTKLSVRALPSFEEFDEDGHFLRYSRTLEDRITFEINQKSESEPLLNKILEEIEKLKAEQRKFRAWDSEHIDRYLAIIKLYEETLIKLDINIYDVPSSYVSYKFKYNVPSSDLSMSSQK